jgi:3-hydroxybutyrate dehydrogenase
MIDLKGKTALVTGSVQGIGFAIARALASAGARIAVNGLAGDAAIHEACEAFEEAGAPQAEFFHGDLRNPDDIARMMEAVRAWGGRTFSSTTPASSTPHRSPRCPARNGMRSFP